MNRYDEIRQRLSELQVEVVRLASIEDISEEDNARLESHLTEIDELTAEQAPLAERAARIEAVRAMTVERADGDGARGAAQTRESFHAIIRPSNDDIFDLRHVGNVEPTRQRAELRERAMRAIETGPHMTAEHREAAERVIASDDRQGSKARWILEHGSAAYHEAFQDYLANPHAGPTQGRADRAALSLTGANGGYLVPFTLDPTIILTNDGATNPFRDIATIKTITTDDWNGVTSAGVTAEWIAEATEVADGSPTFAQPSITVHKADAYIQASMEVVADSGISGDITMLIADAKGRLEAAAFATGSGSGQPYGIVTELNLVTASRVAGSSGAAGAADFVLADVYALVNALPPRHRPGSAWLSEQSIQNRIRRFGEGSNGSNSAFWADLNVDTPPLLLGRPVYESSAMDSTIVSGSNDNVLILGAFKNYYIVDRMGLELQFNPMVLGSNRRPTGEVAWVAFWRVGARAVDPNAFRMLRV
jgi:HK97 family phage major capsid protein